ncbi:MAG: cob(I)yrinic acid a,c-diamide adenosyltransferase [Alistipes sp.]|nr:cob(I)yrinic acid a,c-diamide adenosyltransferase [Alistipes sp.]MDE6857630.1 cob(I)yrinic acid a,c-diamide adenosyltransferase [Alistipes sp.]
MKVYTKTGDEGLTSLIGGQRVLKFDERVEAYGAVDELGAFTALLGDRMRAYGELSEFAADTVRIGSDLMTVEALLAVGRGGEGKVAGLRAGAVEWLEERIDAMQSEVPAITRFTIPGGCEPASMCHVCRTVCRRAERAAVRAAASHDSSREAVAYLNRLADYFYLLGRAVTARLGVEELQWEP